MSKNYTLRILPLFEEDLNSIVDYISDQLQNPTAARNLVNDVEAAIMKRLPNAESFAPYQSVTVHSHPYYYIQIHNYLVFYVVIDDVMEVRRIVYSRRDMTKQI